MKLPKFQFGMKALLAVMLLVAVACAAWPRLQPFCCLGLSLNKGSVTGTETIYVWRNGLAIAVTKFPGEWPSFHRCTDIDVEELLKEEEKALREDAEQARADAAQKTR
ncbi:MAG TPA: hypothetical protein PK867_10860 [Pirellulales bacterium]|nr:hypothetical protein [Pirellulales bacterium]